MSRIVQEKSQTESAYSSVDDSHGGWLDDQAARVKKPMTPEHDQSQRESNSPFYGEVTVDGKTGFLHRNDVMERN
jgi:hypothetical protein